MKVFVIIVTYKGERWYSKCLGSLRESTIPVQVVAVDNSPGDSDSKYIKMHFPEVHLIKTNENLGFGKANNLGMRYALDNGCDYVFLLNQDTWIEPDAIKRLVCIAEVHSEYGIISPIHLASDKNSLNMMYEYSNHSFSHNLLNDLYCRNQLKDIYQTDYVNAAAWLLPRKTLETVGGFDPIFCHYEEDDSYLLRVQYHRLKIGICPSATIVHDHVESALSDGSLQIRQQQYLLVDWTNLNVPYSYYKRLLSYAWRVCRYAMCGQFEKAKGICQTMRYLRVRRKDVNMSRMENSKKQASWL